MPILISLFIKFNNFLLQIDQVRRLHIKLLILLFQHSQVLLQLHLLLHCHLTLHPRQSLLLRLLSYLPLEALSVNPFPQHRDLVLIESLDIVNHRCLLLLLLRLSFSELALLLQQFILLEI